LKPSVGNLLRYLAVLLGISLIGNNAAASERCEPDAIGVRDKATIDAFVAAVRKALGASGTAQFAALVGYPLKVNGRDPEYGQVRTLAIRNVSEFEKYGDAVLTKGFRDEILKAPPDDLICRTGQLGFDRGLLWAMPDEKGRLWITAVNSPGFRWPNMTAAKLLECETADHVVVVDRPRSQIRYRSWATGRPTQGRPDLTIEGGEEDLQGSGVCSHPMWTFTKGAFKYVVEEEGCSNGSGPQDRVGFVSVIKNGSTQKRWDCLSK